MAQCVSGPKRKGNLDPATTSSLQRATVRAEGHLVGLKRIREAGETSGPDIGICNTR